MSLSVDERLDALMVEDVEGMQLLKQMYMRRPEDGEGFYMAG
jgi:hypothetical protein